MDTIYLHPLALSPPGTSISSRTCRGPGLMLEFIQSSVVTPVSVAVAVAAVVVGCSCCSCCCCLLEVAGWCVPPGEQHP